MDCLNINRNQPLNWPLTVLLLSVLVSGCAAMSKNECQTAQWQSVGYEDGAKGYSVSRIGEYRKSCAEYNVAPDLATYTEGRRQGLQEWCTPSNGYLQGTRGAIYNGICPKTLETEFKQSMQRGKVVFDMRQTIKNQKVLIARLNRDLTTIEQEISDKEAELVSNNTHPGRRILLLDQIRKADQDRQAVRYDISEANSSLGEMKSHIQQLLANDRYN